MGDAPTAASNPHAYKPRRVSYTADAPLTRGRPISMFEKFGMSRISAPREDERCGMRVALARHMLRTRPVWMRGLSLYRAIGSARATDRLDFGDGPSGPPTH